MLHILFAALFTVLIIALKVMLWLLPVLLYFLPTIIAFRRRHPRRGAIFLLNVLLGWTMIGWIATFAWSLMGESRTAAA